MSKYVMGIDIGTTSAKAVLFLKNGTFMADHEEFYPVLHSVADWAEQDPFQVEEAVIESIKGVLEKKRIKLSELLSIGFANAMHALICVDQMGEPLSQAIIWSDRRAEKEASNLKNSSEGFEIYQQTGTPIHPMSPLTKLLWMKENAYQPYLLAKKFISIKEFIIKRWFGEYVIDYATASATGLFNIHSLTWHEKSLEISGIKEEQLSEAVPPTYILGGVTEVYAAKMGIRSSTPFVIGGSDGAMANIGTGAIETGDTAITIGTSGAIRQIGNAPRSHPKQEVFCYAITGEHWVFGGPSNNGGNVLQWLQELFAEEGDSLSYQQLLQEAEKASPGSEGVLFLPYINGERAPHWNVAARGSFIGLHTTHGKKHMIRASLEGVMFNMLTIHEALNQLAGETRNLYATGGFCRSPLWLSILADIFEQEIFVPESHQSSAWGAAWVSMLAIKEVRSLEEIKNFIPMKSSSILPRESNQRIYREQYDIFTTLYTSLKPAFTRLSSLQGREVQ